MELLLMICPGFVLVYGGYRLARTDICPEFYPSIAIWCLVGFRTMVVILVLYDLQPATGVSMSNPVAPILTALSSVAGYGIGLNNARAKSYSGREYDSTPRSSDSARRTSASNSSPTRPPTTSKNPSGWSRATCASSIRRCEDKLDEEGKEYLKIAVDSADRMGAMVNGLLRYSRVASNDDPLEPVDLESVLADVRSDLRMQIEADLWRSSRRSHRGR